MATEAVDGVLLSNGFVDGLVQDIATKRKLRSMGVFFSLSKRPVSPFIALDLCIRLRCEEQWLLERGTYGSRIIVIILPPRLFVDC